MAAENARQMILQACRLPQTPLVGGPEWLSSDPFDVEAKASGPADP